jgi:hypothetical protein
MMLFSRVLKDISTEKDGTSFDTARILWVIGTLIFFGLVIYTTILAPSTFNMINFGIAFGGILAGGGASIKIKETTEQDVPGDNQAITTSSRVVTTSSQTTNTSGT